MRKGSVSFNKCSIKTRMNTITNIRIANKAKDGLDLDIIREKEKYIEDIKLSKQTEQLVRLNKIRASFNPLQCLAAEVFEVKKN